MDVTEFLKLSDSLQYCYHDCIINTLKYNLQSIVVVSQHILYYVKIYHVNISKHATHINIYTIAVQSTSAINSCNMYTINDTILNEK